MLLGVQEQEGSISHSSSPLPRRVFDVESVIGRFLTRHIQPCSKVEPLFVWSLIRISPSLIPQLLVSFLFLVSVQWATQLPRL